MAKRKNLVKPKSKTLKKAERDLHNKKASKTVKGPAGYTVRNAKGVKVRHKRGSAR
ncbi:MAG TPA: hypothetical protein VMR59_01280 [Patescibacteria group bacterium]|jgi:hypothetical protein|nr:hypothetical protein [Patescibacteria group bacterium]